VIQVPVQVSDLKPYKDRSWKVSFSTRELNGDEVKVLVDSFQGEGWLVFSPNELTEKDIPSEEADSGMEGKTLAQRLRSVLYVFWAEAGKKGNFSEFYERFMEKQIESIKEKLDGKS
jgi:hypothetical protein